MYGHFGGDLDGNEGLRDVVGPEDVEDLQSDHHAGHEKVGEVKHFQFELVHDLGQLDDDGLQGGVDAAVAEDHDAAPHPADEGVHVDAVQHSLREVLVVLSGGSSTL